MKGRITAALLMFMPTALLADALAEAVTVFDADTFRAMTATNAIGALPDRELFSKSLVRGCYFAGERGKSQAVDFTWKSRKYRLLISRGETKVMYAVLRVRQDVSPEVVAVGKIQRVALNREIKEDTNGDPFVVVVRTGNYLFH